MTEYVVHGTLPTGVRLNDRIRGKQSAEDAVAAALEEVPLSLLVERGAVSEHTTITASTATVEHEVALGDVHDFGPVIGPQPA